MRHRFVPCPAKGYGRDGTLTAWRYCWSCGRLGANWRHWRKGATR